MDLTEREAGRKRDTVYGKRRRVRSVISFGITMKLDTEFACKVSHLAEAMRSYRVGALVIPHTALEMWNMVVWRSKRSIGPLRSLWTACSWWLSFWSGHTSYLSECPAPGCQAWTVELLRQLLQAVAEPDPWVSAASCLVRCLQAYIGRLSKWHAPQTCANLHFFALHFDLNLKQICCPEGVLSLHPLGAFFPFPFPSPFFGGLSVLTNFCSLSPSWICPGLFEHKGVVKFLSCTVASFDASFSATGIGVSFVVANFIGLLPRGSCRIAPRGYCYSAPLWILALLSVHVHTQDVVLVLLNHIQVVSLQLWSSGVFDCYHHPTDSHQNQPPPQFRGSPTVVAPLFTVIFSFGSQTGISASGSTSSLRWLLSGPPPYTYLLQPLQVLLCRTELVIQRSTQFLLQRLLHSLPFSWYYWFCPFLCVVLCFYFLLHPRLCIGVCTYSKPATSTRFNAQERGLEDGGKEDVRRGDGLAPRENTQNEDG